MDRYLNKINKYPIIIREINPMTIYHSYICIYYTHTHLVIILDFNIIIILFIYLNVI